MKTQRIKPFMANLSRVVVENVAKHYANVACPFFTYQPKVTKEIKKIRRF